MSAVPSNIASGRSPSGRIATYTMVERVSADDFSVRDETDTMPNAVPHRHEYFQIQFNLAGDTLHHLGAVRRPIRAGTVSFVLPYRVHYIAHAPASRYFIVNANPRFLHPELDVDPLDLEDVPLDRAPELAPFVFQEHMDFVLTGDDFDEAVRLCRAMKAEAATRGYCSAPRLRAQLVLFISIVCRAYADVLQALAATRAPSASRRDALARIGRFIRENYHRSISLGDAASACFLSPNYLAHLLKKETGKTFTDLLTERRMERAIELLVHSNERIAGIGHAVGFDDEAYFTRRFKQLYGVSPSAYRLRHGPAAG